MTTTLFLALVGLANAQDAEAVPEIDAQLFRPSIDAERLLWTEDAEVGASGQPMTRVVAAYALNPFVVAPTDEELIEHALTTHLMGGHAMGPVRVGAALPVMLFSTSPVREDQSFEIGDARFEAKIGLIDREDFPVRFAVDGGVTLPSATVTGFGSDGVGWRVGGIADARFGRFFTALNAGFAGVPEQRLGFTVVDDNVFARLAGGYGTEELGAAIELGGHWVFDRVIDEEAAVPLEGLLSGYWRVNESFTLRGGAGRGFDDGIGASDLRVAFGVSWAPPVAGIETAALAPETTIHVQIADPEGRGLHHAHVTIEGEGQALEWETGDFVAALEPGVYEITAEAEGFRTITGRFEVPESDGVWRFHRELESVGVAQSALQTDRALDEGPRTGTELAVAVHFPTDRTILTDEAEQRLARIVTILRQPGIHRVEIAGHADERGPSTYNMELSNARAVVVRDWLIEQGVDPRKLDIVPFGETFPIGEGSAVWEDERRVRFFIVEMEPGALERAVTQDGDVPVDEPLRQTDLEPTGEEDTFIESDEEQTEIRDLAIEEEIEHEQDPNEVQPLEPE